MSQKIRVVFADDHLMIADFISQSIDQQPDFEIIAVVNDGLQLIEKVKADPPDLIITDIEMPHMNGIAALKILQKDFPQIPVIVISIYNDRQLIEQLMQLGARGFITKDTPGTVLFPAMRKVVAGFTYFSPAQKKPLQETKKKRLLSRREIEVLELVGAGKTSAEIAEQLNITTDTVVSHRKNILRKLNITGKNGLLRYALSYIKPYGANDKR